MEEIFDLNYERYLMENSLSKTVAKELPRAVQNEKFN